MAIKLIAGLGNPGKDYQSHRHNAGFWFVDTLADLHCADFKPQSKFFGEVARVNISKLNLYLLKPNTYMNHSGRSIQSMAKFYQIKPDEILVTHDELDYDAGVAKIKYSGGHGGHGGLRDTIKALGSNDFYRLRIGIGHPGNKSQVVNFVLKAPNKTENQAIQNAIHSALGTIKQIVLGEFDAAMNALHTG